MRTPLITAAVIVVYLDGLGWALGALPTLLYAFRQRELPKFMGIPLMGGPFEALGMDSFIVAGFVFVVISALKVLAGYWLWEARRDGAVLEIILLGLSAIFWYGFALPLGPVEGVAELVLLGLAWGSLR